MKAAKVI